MEVTRIHIASQYIQLRIECLFIALGQRMNTKEKMSFGAVGGKK